MITLRTDAAFILEVVKKPWDLELRGVYADSREDELGPEHEEVQFWRRGLHDESIESTHSFFEPLLPLLADRWIEVGLRAQPADRDGASHWLGEIYQNWGLTPPREILWADSPLAGMRLAGELGMGSERVRPLHNQVYSRVYSQVLNQVYSQVVNQVRGQVRDPVRDRVWDRVWDRIYDQVGNQSWIPPAAYGQHDAAWVSYYATFLLMGVRTCERIIPWMRLAECGGWWWGDEARVVLTERPTICEVDEEKVRVVYPDGFEVAT